MPADAATSSPSVPDLQRRIDELSAELRARTADHEEALRREGAIAEILQVTNASAGDLARVFGAMIERATRLCSGACGYIWLYDGQQVVPMAAHAQPEFGEWLRQRGPSIPASETPLGRLLVDHRLIHVVDAREDPAYRSHQRFRELVDQGGLRTLLHVPLCKGKDLLGVITIYRQERRPFTAADIGLLEAFADQAVIAMENARLLNELRDRTRDLAESLEYQSATGEVLNVISRSPTDTQPVFEAIAESTARLCQVEFCHVYRFDGELIHFMASYGHTPHATEAIRQLYPTPPSRRSCAARAILSGTVEQVPDIRADRDYAHGDVADILKTRSVVAVPMLKEGRPVGAIALLRAAPGLFPQRQIELLQTFADQAVIAINNVRLFDEVQARARDLQESLEHQTATSDVLKVISRSTFDLHPVLQTLAETAARLCAAEMCYVLRREGEVFRAAAVAAASLQIEADAVEHLRFLEAHPLSAGRGSLTGRVALEQRAVQINDVTADPEYALPETTTLGKIRTQVGVPLVREGALIGVIILSRQRVAPFNDRQVELLCTFADQAVIAIENTRLITEQREALEQQTAAAEVLQVINASPGNLTPVFETILVKAHALCGVAFGSLQLYDGERMRAAATHGLVEAFANQLRQGYTPGPNHPIRHLLEGNDFLHMPDLAEIDDPVAQSGARLGGLKTALFVALRKDNRLLGMIVSARDEVRPFADKEISLLRSFAAQAVIAMENARLLTEQREALEQQTATAEVLQVINSSPGNLAPVFDVMLEKATRLCEADAGVFGDYRGDHYQVTALRGFPGMGDFPRSLFKPHPETGIGRVASGEDVVHILDSAAGEAYRAGDPGRRAIVDLGGARTQLCVALRKDRILLGVFTVWRREVRPFTDKQIALLQNFAAQAVIAMENARLLTEQREALEQQTATAEVLQVINASPGDLAPVFEAMLEKAMTLCSVAFGFLTIYDGKHFTPAAMRGVPPALAEYFAAGMDQPRPGDAHFRVLEGEDIVHLDQRDDEAYRSGSPLRRAIVDLGSARSALVIALRKEGVVLGALTVYRKEVRPFSDKEIALMQNFAAQAVVAMENARLLTEQREALDRQTATAEVLQVINSSPGNLTPVFDAMLEKAMTLCGAAFGMFNTFDGRHFHSVAMRGVPEAYAQYRMVHPPDYGPATGPGRLLAGEDCIHIVDLTEGDLHQRDPNRRAIVELGGARTILNVALRKEGVLLGMIAIYRQEVRPFADKQIALLQNFAAQAVIAMENARLLTEQREALEQQTATAEVLEVINASPGNLAPVFDAMLERAVRLSESAFGMMNLYENGRFKGVALRGVPPGILSFEAAPQPGRHNALTRLVNGEDVVHLEDLKSYRSYVEGDPRSRNLVDVCGARSLLAVALRKDGRLIGTLTAYRQEVRPFSDKQIALLEGFAAQAVIAIENARLLDELRQRTDDLTESLEYQTATSEVLEVIGRSTSDVQPVLDTMLKAALRLCRTESGGVAIQHGDSYRYVATLGWDVEADKAFRSLDIRAGRGTVAARVIAEGRIVQVADVASDPEFGLPDMAERSHWHTALGVPLMRNDRPVGVIAITRDRVEPFTERQIALVKTFADQAVIAIENARLLNEQHEALEQQTATAEVLQVINASPGNLAPVFDAILDKAHSLCGAEFGALLTYDGKSVRLAAERNLPPAWTNVVRGPWLPRHDHPVSRIIRGERLFQIDDMAEIARNSDDPVVRAALELGGIRSLLLVPLRKDDAFLGYITAYRQEVRPFSDKQIALLEGFAAQAVIAIENARLLDELRQRQAELARSVDELTATGDVLKVISRSSVDLKTVLETLVERVARLCSADQGYMFRRQDELHHLVAAYGVSPEGEEFVRTHPFVPERGTTSGRVALERRPVHIVDVLEDPDYTYREGQAVAGFRTMLGIPLLREETLVGVFVLGRTHVNPFTSKEIELVTTFADQAVIAIENARLFEEIRQRQAELRVTFDNMGDGVAMFDADLRLAAWNRNFQKIIGLSDADLAARPTYEAYLRMLADRGEFGADNVEAALASRLKDTDKELRLERTRTDGTVIEARRNAVPGGGFVLIYSDITERKRSEAEIRAARDLAETTLKELKTAQSSLIHAEKMASLGQLTAGIAHEIKNPLNFVNNFAGLSVELLDELKETMASAREVLDAERRTEIDETIELLNTNLDKIASHGRRADGIVKSMLLHSRGGSGDRQSVDINAVLEEALNLAYHGARAQDQSFNVTLERELQPDIAPIEIVPQDVTRVFLNLISNGFYAVARRARLGGDASFRPTLKVRTKDLGGAVEIAIRDNGTGISPEHRARLFQPFFTTKPTGEGTGLGLSISYDIITQQHAGTIEVDSEPGQFTQFTVRLPRRGSAATGRGQA